MSMHPLLLKARVRLLKPVPRYFFFSKSRKGLILAFSLARHLPSLNNLPLHKMHNHTCWALTFPTIMEKKLVHIVDLGGNAPSPLPKGSVDLTHVVGTLTRSTSIDWCYGQEYGIKMEKHLLCIKQWLASSLIASDLSYEHGVVIMNYIKCSDKFFHDCSFHQKGYPRSVLA